MKNLSKEKIKKEFEKNGLSFNRIARTRLGDGFFIYHNRAMGFPIKKYKRRFIKKNPDGSELYERTRETKILKRSFVDSKDMLQVVIMEAKRR